MKTVLSTLACTASRRLAGICVIAVCLVLVATGAGAEATIFYYKDSQGVFHFTNNPGLHPEPGRYRGYSIFAVFRDHPEVSRDDIHRLARKYSRMYGMDPRLIMAVIEVESGYEPEAISSAGAEGLMQIMPETQKELGVEKPFDPEENIEAGVRYLRRMLDRFRSVELALAAYNAGPSHVEKYGGIPPFDETQRYVAKVMARLKGDRIP